MGEPLRIGVVGLGAVGGWLAARLALAGHQVTGFVRSERLRSMADGLQLQADGATFAAPVRLSDQPYEPQDVLIIATKATGLAAAAEWSRPLIGPETAILPLQNGVPFWFAGDEPLRSVDPAGRIAAALPARQLVAGVVHAAVRSPAPGEIVLVHADKLILGEPHGGHSDRVERLAGLFTAAAVPAVADPDVRRAIWYKLWGNCTLNPLSALTRASCDQVLADPDLRRFIAAGMADAAAVGAAIGCPISESADARMAVTARLGAFKTSMLQDLEAGRPLELDALLGAPRELGRRHGVPTPALDQLDALVRTLAANLGLLPK
ncbi:MULTISPECIES: ketopantoate reductase family protein [Sphingomonas]|uniref:ketopantoate reductase family protein n=1 Tax=Sphingomonas TaxID=13687 RepID=UPI000DEF2FF3|nr:MULTISPECIES: 2-dehydropantoate 2-reductase [Sphingomonas]